jgi:hypothetical protein
MIFKEPPSTFGTMNILREQGHGGDRRKGGRSKKEEKGRKVRMRLIYG